MSERLSDRESRREFYRKEAELAQQKKDKKAKDFWSQPWNKIAHVALLDDAAWDDLGLPERKRDIPREELFALCTAFKAELEERGYELLHARKLEKFLSVQYERGKDLSLDMIRLVFDRLSSLGCFSNAEISFDASKAPVPETEHASEPTLDDILTKTDTTTRLGQQTAKRVLDREYFGVEAREVWSQFWDHMLTTFNYVAPESVKRQFFDEFGRRNLSYLSGKSYDQVRVAFCRRGIIPDTCLTADEKLCFEIEDAKTSVSDRETRIDIARKQRQIHGQWVTEAS